jgi:FlaA1/EpsC-like NDP-sugar epimerase
MVVTKSRHRFLDRYSLKKMIVDTVIVAVACVIVYALLPRSATFFNLAAAHTTVMQKALHSAIALGSILFFRMLLMVYRQDWLRMKTMGYLNIILADIVAGICYYLIIEFALHSVYPFLLSLALFAISDIVTLFIRILYRGFNEEYGQTEQ